MKYLVFDLETGGLDERECGITQIAAVVAEGDPGRPGVSIAERFAVTVNPEPGMRYEPKALELCGLTAEALEAGEDVSYAIQGLASFVAREFGEARKCTPCAHNSEFDMRFLSAACERQGLPMPFNRAHVCTMQMFRALRFAGYHDCYRATLDDAMRVFGVAMPEDERHTALGDVEATAAVLVAMLRAIRKGQT